MADPRFIKLGEITERAQELKEMLANVRQECDLYRAYPEMAEQVSVLRAKLLAMLEEVDGWGSEDLPYRKAAINLANRSLESAQNVHTYNQLREMVVQPYILNKEEETQWQKLQIAKLPSWWTRLRAKPEAFSVESPFDALIELRLAALNRSDKRGFNLKPEDLIFRGSLKALSYLARHDKIKAVIIEAYPDNLTLKEKQLSTDKYWLHYFDSSLEQAAYSMNTVSVGDMQQYGQLRFLCENPGDQEIAKRGLNLSQPSFTDIVCAGLPVSGKKDDFRFWKRAFDIKGGWAEFLPSYTGCDPDGDAWRYKHVVNFSKRFNYGSAKLDYLVL